MIYYDALGSSFLTQPKVRVRPYRVGPEWGVLIVIMSIHLLATFTNHLCFSSLCMCSVSFLGSVRESNLTCICSNLGLSENRRDLHRTSPKPHYTDYFAFFVDSRTSLSSGIWIKSSSAICTWLSLCYINYPTSPLDPCSIPSQV